MLDTLRARRVIAGRYATSIMRTVKSKVMYRKLATLLFGLMLMEDISLTRPIFAQAQVARQTNQKWRAATFQSLILGKSTRADMLRVFGKPVWSGDPQGQTKADPNPVTWNSYDTSGEFPGELTVEVEKRSGVIPSIYLYPKRLSKAQLIERFGGGYIITKYAFDECLGNGESAPIYECVCPASDLDFVEYREKGIAVSLSYDDNVNDIRYVSAPIGATGSKCKARQRSKSKPKRRA